MYYKKNMTASEYEPYIRYQNHEPVKDALNTDAGDVAGKALLQNFGGFGNWEL